MKVQCNIALTFWGLYFCNNIRYQRSLTCWTLYYKLNLQIRKKNFTIINFRFIFMICHLAAMTFILMKRNAFFTIMIRKITIIKFKLMIVKFKLIFMKPDLIIVIREITTIKFNLIFMKFNFMIVKSKITTIKFNFLYVIFLFLSGKNSFFLCFSVRNYCCIYHKINYLWVKLVWISQRINMLMPSWV